MRSLISLLFGYCANTTLQTQRASGNRKIRTKTHIHRQYKDIPGMLLFDSDLLCVDGLIDAHSLWKGGKESQGRETENTNQCIVLFPTAFTEMKIQKCQAFHLKALQPFHLTESCFFFSSPLGKGETAKLFEQSDWPIFWSWYSRQEQSVWAFEEVYTVKHLSHSLIHMHVLWVSKGAGVKIIYFLVLLHSFLSLPESQDLGRLQAQALNKKIV